MRRSLFRRPRHQLSTLTEINITPLLDLAFVLLIIFMITTPLMENTLDLIVPNSSTSKNSISQEVQTISVKRDSSLMLNGLAITAEELERRLAGLYQQDLQMTVVIRADHELPLQKFIHVMDLLGRIGISKVGVMAHPEALASGIQ